MLRAGYLDRDVERGAKWRALARHSPTVASLSRSGEIMRVTQARLPVPVLSSVSRLFLSIEQGSSAIIPDVLRRDWRL